MAWKCEKTHRCSGSLENRISIRKNANRWHYDADGIVTGWTLWNREHDLDYDCYLDIMVARITFCPFCGKRLMKDGDINV